MAQDRVKHHQYPPKSRKKRPKLFKQDRIFPILTILLILIIWELYTSLKDTPSYLLPSPGLVGQKAVANFPLLVNHFQITLMEVIIGFALGVIIAIPLGILIVYSRVIENSIYVLLVSSQAIPKVALAPLLVIWLGFGQTPKILVTFLVCFFPIVVNTVIGIKATPIEMIYLARSLGASALEIFWRFRLPYGLPYIFGGLKVAISLAVVGAVIGEFVAGESGLGYLQTMMAGKFDTAMVFVVLVSLSLMGIVLFYVVDFIERLFIRENRQLENVKEN